MPARLLPDYAADQAFAERGDPSERRGVRFTQVGQKRARLELFIQLPLLFMPCLGAEV